MERLSGSSNASFLEIMATTRLSRGITDDDAKIVALLGGTYRHNPGLVEVLLDPARITIEERTIRLPFSGVVNLAIVRTAPGSPHTMDLLEHSVRQVEEFMGAPLPTSQVSLLFENALPEFAGGTHFGSHITMRPEYDVDDDSSLGQSCREGHCP